MKNNLIRTVYIKNNLARWWFNNKRSIVITVSIVAAIGIVIMIVLAYWFNWSWTGFGSDTTDPKQHSKTLWDWLQLLAALLIPAMIALFSIRYSTIQSQTANKIARNELEENALQSYLDRMSELLLDRKLRTSKIDEEVRNVARAQTLTVLARLDASRKGSVIQFLYESKLIDVIDLSQAELGGAYLVDARLNNAILSHAYLNSANLIRGDLDGANLSGAWLQEAELGTATLNKADLSWALLNNADLRDTWFCDANLSDANLSEADLNDADLSGANLSGADLSGANLSGADLSGANLSGTIITREQILSTLKKDKPL